MVSLNIYYISKLVSSSPQQTVFFCCHPEPSLSLGADQVVNMSQRWAPLMVPRSENAGLAALNCGHLATKK